MNRGVPGTPQKARKALVAGVANEHSIGCGCAAAFREVGAAVALTYRNEAAKPHVEPLARKPEAPVFMPLRIQSRRTGRDRAESTAGELVEIMEVRFTCAYSATHYARRLSGSTLYVDGGVNIMA